jgi:hypothetical protein
MGGYCWQVSMQRVQILISLDECKAKHRIGEDISTLGKPVTEVPRLQVPFSQLDKVLVCKPRGEQKGKGMMLVGLATCPQRVLDQHMWLDKVPLSESSTS